MKRRTFLAGLALAPAAACLAATVARSREDCRGADRVAISMIDERLSVYRRHASYVDFIEVVDLPPARWTGAANISGG